jgi:hypothetical protein
MQVVLWLEWLFCERLHKSVWQSDDEGKKQV